MKHLATLVLLATALSLQLKTHAQTPGTIAKYDASSALVSSIITESTSGSFIGINMGATAPTYTLDVNGNLRTTQDVKINGITVGRGLLNDQYSTAVGYTSLGATTSGVKNTMLGYQAGSNITTGQLNTGVGFGALYAGAGSGSTALGSYAMQYWQSGNYNIGIGYDVMHGTNSTSGGTGAGNIAIGRLSMGASNPSGNYNVALGYVSLPFVTTGANNIAVGYNAGYTLTTGGSNILIGTSANASSATASNELNIGNWIYGTGGNIGIGAASPANKLQITHGTSGNSGLRFTNLTSASTAATSSGKVLSVDANGDVVLEVAGSGGTADGSETKVVSGSANVTVSGTGTTATPYSISVSSPASYWNNSSIGSNNITNTNTGGVIIGSSITGIPASGYKLYVESGIITERVKVKLLSSGGAWPDYVFAKDYKLPSLKETEDFIKLNSHLPGVPSAAEVKKEGIELGETNAVLLKKIEELTLYMIAADKEIKSLQQKVKVLEANN